MKDQIPDPYELAADDDVEVVALPGVLDTLRRAARRPGGLFGWAAQRQGVEALEGRGVAYHVPAPGGDERWVVRHYRRGGFVARFVRDRYMDIGRRRPVRELTASVKARQRGIDTPEVIGFALYPVGVWYRADMVTRLVPGSCDLSHLLFGAEGRARAAPEVRLDAMRTAGAALRHAHDNGLVHNDLNVKNILLSGTDAGGSRAWLLDLDRAVVVRDAVARFERNAMLRRFSRSLGKWEKGRGCPLDAGEREAFADAYARSAT